MKYEYDGLYLGYDATCGDCSNIARSIRREAGDHIEVISLRSEQMREWRRHALGDGAPWAPTLVRVSDGKANAWTGWQIAPILARELDAKTTWRILGALGGTALGNKRLKPSVITRSTFIRGVFGSVVGLGVLMKAGSAAASPPQNSTATNVGPERITTLGGERLLAAAMRGLATEDIANVADATSLVSPGAPVPMAHKTLPRTSLRGFDDNLTGEAPPPNGELEVYGVEIDRGHGIIETGLAYYQHDQQMLVHVRILSKPLEGILTSAHRLHVEHGPTQEHPYLSTVAQSVNGAIPTPVPESDVGTLSSDPCGGCPGCGGTCGSPVDKYMSGSCNWSGSWQCIFSAVGCAACFPCAVVSIPCIVCAITSCATAIDACCSPGPPKCNRCAVQT